MTIPVPLTRALCLAVCISQAVSSLAAEAARADSPRPSVGGVFPHLAMVADHSPDFCSWRGMLVLGGNQSTPMRFTDSDRNLNASQPQAGLWFGKTDDLWSFGKPKASGGVWRDPAVKAGEPSAPFLMNGFDKKVVHLKHDQKKPVAFRIEIED